VEVVPPQPATTMVVVRSAASRMAVNDFFMVLDGYG
jgi:hypothetical protein